MPKSKKRTLIFAIQLISAAVLAAADQLIKKAAVENLRGKDDIVLIKNIIGLTYAENTGAAFSAFSNSTMLLSVVTLVMLLAGVVYLFFAKIQSKIVNVGAAMILGGGIGNLIDRFARGYVVDYIETLFVDFPIYNFADILVTCGVIMVCAYLVYEIVREEKNKRQKNGAADDGNS